MKYKDLTITQKILLFFVEKGLVLKEIHYHPSRMAYNYLYHRDRISRQVFYNTLKRLKKHGYLVEVEQGGERRYRATLKGKAKILRFLKKDKKWDGKWRIVIFDIPERKKKMRNFFRQKLGDLGFRQLQKSVWICPYNIADKVEEIIDLCQAKSFVHYLLVEELDNRNVLMNLFKLSEE